MKRIHGGLPLLALVVVTACSLGGQSGDDGATAPPDLDDVGPGDDGDFAEPDPTVGDPTDDDSSADDDAFPEPEPGLDDDTGGEPEPFPADDDVGGDDDVAGDDDVPEPAPTADDDVAADDDAGADVVVPEPDPCSNLEEDAGGSALESPDARELDAGSALLELLDSGSSNAERPTEAADGGADSVRPAPPMCAEDER